MTAAFLLALVVAASAVLAPAAVAQRTRGSAVSPDSLRESLRRHLARSIAVTSDSERTRHLDAARSLARDYATTWRDSLLLRQVERFERWPPRDRAVKVAADSLRRAGFEAYPRAGADAAMALWGDSRRRSAAIGDSAGLAATYGNLAAGFLALDNLDSARWYLGRARAIAQPMRDWRILGNALGTLGAVEKAAGNVAHARDAYLRALVLRQRSGDDRGAAADENNLGLLAEGAGDTAAARRYFTAALTRNRRAGRGGAGAVNLVNLANLDVAAVRYASASDRYRQALALHRQAGERAGMGLDLRAIGGLELRQGKYRAAIAAFAEAVALLIETGPPDEAVAAQAELAQAHAAMGDLEAAIRVVDRAETGSRNAPPGDRALLALVRGDLAVDAGAPEAALRAYALAESLYRSVGDSNGTIAAQQGLGTLQVRRGDHDGGARTLASAALAQRRLGDDRGAALTDLTVGGALVERGDTAGAFRIMTRARLALRRLADPVGEAAAFAALGDLAERRGLSKEAGSLRRAGLERMRGHAAPDVEVRLRWGLGRSLRAQHSLGAAARELETAVAATERIAGRLTTDDLRASMFGEMTDMYADLALVEHARGRDASAFETSERLRSRQMRELVGRGLVSPPPGLDPLLVERERELRHRVDELERGTSVASTRAAPMRDPAEGPRDAGRREALAQAQAAYASVAAQLDRASPRYATLLRQPPVTHRDVASHLRTGEALLEYLVTDSATLLFVVTRDSLVALPIAISRRELAAAIDFARAAIGRNASSGMLREPWALPLRRLHRLLVQPAEASGLLQGVQTLIIAPHGELHYLPFAALMPASGPRYLIERYDVAYVPSATIWRELASRSAGVSNGKALVVAPFPQSLPGSRKEAASIQHALGRDVTLLIGADATEAAFARSAPGHAVLHLATYGVLNRHSPLFSYVAFAPSRSGGDRLEVHEVFGMSLRARLLVLSACETGLGSGTAADVPPGDDWVSLVRAFLFAGVDNVMATLWPIDDRATSLIVPRFYQSFPSDNAARSLAVAQRAALRNPATAAPRHWSAFVLVGAVR